MWQLIDMLTELSRMNWKILSCQYPALTKPVIKCICVAVKKADPSLI